MSNGLDALANQQAPGYLVNILESRPEETYAGQEFAGPLVSDTVTDMSNQDMHMGTTAMFGTDSLNNLGTDTSFDVTSAPQVEMR